MQKNLLWMLEDVSADDVPDEIYTFHILLFLALDIKAEILKDHNSYAICIFK